jgi:hypothetical protein
MLGDQRILRSALLDLMQRDASEQIMVLQAVDNGLGELLARAVVANGAALSTEQAALLYEQAMRTLVDKRFLCTDVAEFVISCFFEALGWEVPAVSVLASSESAPEQEQAEIVKGPSSPSATPTPPTPPTLPTPPTPPTPPTLPTPPLPPSVSASGTIQVGNVVYFGDLNWRVLDIKGNKALLITEDIVEKRSYLGRFEPITWENCDLRRYLNREFIKKHFSQAEAAKIALTRLRNVANSNYGTPSGKDTDDRVFLLSVTEAEAYFQSDADRVARYQSTDVWWWLRSRSSSGARYAVHVDDDGVVIAYGSHVDNDNRGVRPALWLNL